jgi:hypothetical protein
MNFYLPSESSARKIVHKLSITEKLKLIDYFKGKKLLDY